MSDNKRKTMQAVRWEEKPFSVSVRHVPIPKIKHSLDAIIRVTTAGVCGTDLHIYHGRFVQPRSTLGHEIIGIVHEIGHDIVGIKKGDRVVVNADLEEPEDNNSTEDRGSLGISNPPFETFNGGQAEYVRVPWAHTNLLVVPDGKEKELDYLVLSDIWVTAWFALDRSHFEAGDTVVVLGAGPVGLLCAYSAILRGASRVYSVDKVSARLRKAKSIGAIPIDFSEVDPVKAILAREKEGVDRVCECVGFECVDANGKNVSYLTLNWAVQLARRYGGIAPIGVFVPPEIDPKSPPTTKPFPVGEFWLKSQTLEGGVVNTRPIQNILQKLIDSGKAKPSFVFDRNSRYDIEDANEAYRDFSEHRIIKPYFQFDRRGRDRSTSSDRGRSKSPDDHHHHHQNGHGKRKRRHGRSGDSSSSGDDDDDDDGRGRKYGGRGKMNGYHSL